jgi:hypothetical protein
MLELEFEALKYQSFINSNPRFNSYEKNLMGRLISEYFETKRDLKLSQSVNFNFSLEESQKDEIDRLMINPDISFEVKLVCKDILIQIFCFKNSIQGKK